MNKSIDPTLFISLEMLYLEPAGLRFKIRGEEGQGEVYILDRKILLAEFGDLIGVAAIRAVLDRKEHWRCENEESFPQIISWNVCIEQVLLDLLARPSGFTEEELSCIRKVGKSESPTATSASGYEVQLSVQGGPYDGHSFKLFPGENPISQLEFSENEKAGNPACCSIFLEGDGIRLIEREGGPEVFLNGVPVREALLSDGDELVFGKLKLRLHFAKIEPVMILAGANVKEGDERKLDWREGKTLNWKQFAPKK